jgi:hypothetical protein
MATVQLLGRELIPQAVPTGRDVSRLWMYFRTPPAQNSVIIYDDGSVVERSVFENSDIQADDVRVFILGGTRYRTEVGSFEYNALTAAGYTWLPIAEPNTYTEDYEDRY